MQTINYLSYRWLCFLMGLLCFTMIPINEGIADQPGELQMLRKGIEYYNTANFEQSIQLLNMIVNDTNVTGEQQKDAYQYLVRCNVARGKYDKAYNLIQEMFNVSPALIDFDPDVESPPLMRILYQVLKDNTTLSKQMDTPEPVMHTLAIIDFQNGSVDDKIKYDPLEKGFANLMITQLNGATNLKVVERDRVEWILKELEIQQAYEMRGAVQLGDQLGVHLVLIGSYIVVKKDMWLSARLVKVASSEVLITQDVKGKAEDFFDLMQQLSKNVARVIDQEIEFSTVDNHQDSNSLEAMLSYSEGLVFLSKDNYNQAFQKFIEALTYDSEYVRARKKAESIRLLVSEQDITVK